jgi:hypothetical protein
MARTSRHALAQRLCKGFPLFVALTSAMAPAIAAPLLFEYSGVVRHIALIDGAMETFGLTEGSPIQGAFVFDPSGPDEMPGSERAFFSNSIVVATFGSIASEPTQVDYSTFLIDADPFHDHIVAYLSSEYGNVNDIYTFSLDEGGPTAILGSDQVDLTALRLEDFDQADSRFEFLRATFLPDGTVPRTLITAEFLSLQVSDIPEPSTLVLGAAGLSGIVVTRRRRRRPQMPGLTFS